MPSALLIVAGLAGLLVGAELLVRGGAALASHLGVRPIVIGLTVVALGTSLPELAVGIDAARQGSPGLAVGNIVGANLVNLLFVLGLSALIRPIAFERRTLRFDLPAITAASLVLWLLALERQPHPGGGGHPRSWRRRVYRWNHLDEPPGVSAGQGGLRGPFRTNRRSRQTKTPAPRTDDGRWVRAAASGR
jgi:Sodium/calcium exchanger protein